ncbi:uncharacterized protein PGTG_11550 [Puccinia graminis f. sp. tritici CRL 75-36-700-3]|uniref:Uncharacterized protein n=1 Tax=Puccinia graminis f. sp. tritici (strain CRL 75-36-700-3 / race SCCL) TaxID=418459 RepID=E3KM32_PUCGT|nr:uncharacterized protein PGTG_11550 [Puccinia graminis f. sp. tritici CRL 75-36-700-3]EFP85381.2 hypothetical protein PGTG_11550 [Puccinia graminis f. sp. tritici CRL 75-36-700-3]
MSFSSEQQPKPTPQSKLTPTLPPAETLTELLLNSEIQEISEEEFLTSLIKKRDHALATSKSQFPKSIKEDFARIVLRMDCILKDYESNKCLPTDEAMHKTKHHSGFCFCTPKTKKDAEIRTKIASTRSNYFSHVNHTKSS